VPITPEPTPNLHLQPIEANRNTWAEIMNTNLRLIDAVVGSYFVIQNLQGAWQNSTIYTQGQAVIDTDTAVVYQCQIDHTSASVPTTFEEDRAAHTDYWSVYSSPATGKAVLQAASQAAARTAINAQIAGAYVTGGPYQPLGSYQPLSSNLSTLAGVTSGAFGRTALAYATVSQMESALGGLGTAAPLNVGTTANLVVQLDASARLPAVDGSLLTNLTIPDPEYPRTVLAAKFLADGTLVKGYNVASIVKNSMGDFTINHTSNIDVDAYVTAAILEATSDAIIVRVISQDTGFIRIFSYSSGGAPIDADGYYITAQE
jgi:hypothetical protein